MKLGGKGRIVSIKSGEIDMSNNGRPTSIAELKLRNRDREDRRPPEVFNMKEKEQNQNVKEAGDKIAQAFMHRKYGKSEQESKEILSKFPLENPPVEELEQPFTPPPPVAAPPVEDIPLNRPQKKKNLFNLGNIPKFKHTSPLPKEMGPHAKRVPLLSKGLYTDVKEVFLRPFNFTEFCYLQAAMANNDESAILDVFDAAMSCDVRSLLDSDFKYYQWWMLLNSLPSNPIKLKWVSLYGNENEFLLNSSNLAANITDRSQAERDEYPDFSFPTVGDKEAFKKARDAMEAQGEDTQAFTFLVKKAQYLSGDSLEEKIEKAKNASPDALMFNLPKFIKKFSDFGVIEKFTSMDSNFNADDALEVLGFKAAALTERIDILENTDSFREYEIAEMKSGLADVVDEIARIRNDLKTTGEAAPKSETRTFSFDLADFFPEV